MNKRRKKNEKKWEKREREQNETRGKKNGKKKGVRERRQGWKTHLGRWVSALVASPGARSARSIVDLLYKILDQFIIFKKRRREEGNTYLCCFFFFPALSLTSPIVFSVSTLSFLDFFSLVPMLTDEVARLRVTDANDGNGHFVWWICWILYQAWFSEGVVVGMNDGECW